MTPEERQTIFEALLARCREMPIEELEAYVEELIPAISGHHEVSQAAAVMNVLAYRRGQEDAWLKAPDQAEAYDQGYEAGKKAAQQQWAQTHLQALQNYQQRTFLTYQLNGLQHASPSNYGASPRRTSMFGGMFGALFD